MDMTQKKSWEEFRESGLLWWINMILHTFGWALAIEIDSESEELKILNAYPVRTKFRGFDGYNNDMGYRRVTQYMKDNVDELIDEVEDEIHE